MKKNSFESPALETDTIESLSARLLAATSELSASNAQLKKLQQEREEMLANISHDLRAPITAIRSALDYLLSGQTLAPEDCQSALELIDRRTKVLENLIQDMYYLFCVEDSSRALKLESVEAAPFFETYFYDCAADSRYASHQLLLDMPEDLDCRLDIDIQKIIRVLDNLFTNAARYSPAGSSVTLQVRLEEARDALRVSVIDTGEGISPEDLPHIFNRTYTASAARTPGSATGSGLGLSIARAIVERHGGSITCTSQLGVGSCFTLLLPLCRNH